MLGLDPKRKLQRMLSILSTSHIYTEPFNVESKTKGMISGLYQDFLLPKSRARFQTPPSEIVPMHDFVEKCTISCRPSFWEVSRVLGHGKSQNHGQARPVWELSQVRKFFPETSRWS